MNACVIQPFYSLDSAKTEELLQWELDALDRCDPGMDLILLPEYADVPALVRTREELLAASECNTDRLLKKCAETARRCNAVVFVNALRQTHTGLRNTTYAFDRLGQIAGCYDKRHLVPRETDVYRLDSSYTFDPSAPSVLTIDGIRYGFLTCYDFYFYESYPAIARQNIDILIGCSHQRSDPLQTTELICRFCAYHTNAYVLRASVCLEPGGTVGGGSMIVSPHGEVLASMDNRIGMTCAEFDPRKKFFKPAGFGNPPAAHYDYIDQGRRPWQYRPAGSAVCPPDKWMPYPRICAQGGYTPAGPENSLTALASAVALGAAEIAFGLYSCEESLLALPRDAAGYGLFPGLTPPSLEEILTRLSCHALMDIHLRGPFPEPQLIKITQLLFRFDCTGHTCVTSEDPAVLRSLRSLAPWLILCLSGSEPGEVLHQAAESCCQRVLLPGSSLRAETVEAVHAAGLRCSVLSSGTPEDIRRCLALGADTVLTDSFSACTSLPDPPRG